MQSLSSDLPTWHLSMHQSCPTDPLRVLEAHVSFILWLPLVWVERGPIITQWDPVLGYRAPCPGSESLNEVASDGLL